MNTHVRLKLDPNVWRVGVRKIGDRYTATITTTKKYNPLYMYRYVGMDVNPETAVEEALNYLANNEKVICNEAHGINLDLIEVYPHPQAPTCMDDIRTQCEF